MEAAHDDEPIRASVTAFELLRFGRWEAAEQAFATALSLIDPPPHGDGGTAAAQRRQLLVGRAEALAQLGDMAQAERCLLEAFPALGQPRPAGAALDAVEAQALLWLARVSWSARRPGDAVALLRLALDALPWCELVGSRLSELRARILEMLAVGLSATGEVEEALKLHAEVLAVFEHPLHIDLARERATALVNVGVGESARGRHHDALEWLRRGLAVFQGLFDAGGEQERWRAAIALTRMDLSDVLTAIGEFEGAIAMFEAAARGYDVAIARAAGRTDIARLRASRAQTEMNWAYALYKAGQFDAAARHFRSTRRRYAALKLSQPQLRDDEARAWVHQAHMLARQHRFEPARRLYTRGWKAFAALLDDGRPHLAADLASARLGVARMLAAEGRAEAAAAHLDAALSVLVELTERGQLQHSRQWLLGLAEHAGALIEGASAAPQPPGPRDGDALLRALTRPPRYGVSGLAARLELIEGGLDRIEQWSATVAASTGGAPWYAGFASAFFVHLLDALAELLGESDPAELRGQLAATGALVTRLCRVAQTMPQAERLLADWFLRTRGLRAQRSALAAGRDPRLVVLRERLAQLRRLEEEMLAERTAGEIGSPRPMAAKGAEGAAEQGHEAPAAQWRELHAHCDALRVRLVKSGRLPAALRLDARSLAARMRPRSALLMLARGAPDELLAIALHRPNADGACVTQRIVTLDETERQLDCVAVIQLLRQTMRPPGMALRRAPDSDVLELAAGATATIEFAEQSARSVHELIAVRLLRPAVRQLAAQGLTDLSIVPSADLHLLPYHEVLEATLAETGCALSVYPSCGAWAQHHAPGAGTPPRSLAPAWAVVGHAALEGSAPLHWVALEQRLTQRLWGEAMVPIKTLAADALQADGVTALIGMGHGSAPADNPARAGLLVGAGRVLSAHDLPRIHTCHRVILSCCVLGRVDEVHTEAMGFLSSSFGYSTRFGAGWIVEVPDAEACLFSIAFQFALRQAHVSARPGRAVRWNEVFHSVRQGIRKGRWPAGLGTWLSSQLPAAIDESALPGGPWLNRYEYLRDFDGGMFESPPTSLRRLMPWAVTLGR